MAGTRKKSRKRRAARAPSGEGRFRAFVLRWIRGVEADDETSTHLQEIKGLVLMGFALWILVSLASFDGSPHNWGGQAGDYLALWIFSAVGWSGYAIVFLGLTWGIVLVSRKRIGWPLLRVFGGACFLLSSAFLLELGFDDRAALPYGPGGYLAYELVGPGVDAVRTTPILVEKLGLPGLWILLVVFTVISFMLATEMAFYPSAIAFRDWVVEHRTGGNEGLGSAALSWIGKLFAGLWHFLRGTDLEASTVPSALALAPPVAERPAGTRRARTSKEERGLYGDDDDDWDDDDDDGDDEEYEDDDDDEELGDDDDEDEDEDDEDDEADEDDDDFDEDLVWDEGEALTPASGKGKKKPTVQVAGTQERATDMLNFEPPTPPPGDWKYPSIDLLEPPHSSSLDDERSIEVQARRLEHALRSFRVEASVVGAKVGPAVTLFELEVAQGTRMNKVTQLSQEIAAALRAKSVRIIAPIPGKATIGIEVPNEKRRVVRLSELISQKAYDKKFAALPLFLGMDAEGDAIVEDLARMPHLLIAGTTGSGKSVCINSILASLLLTRSPHDVQLILIDPKMVELQMFSNVPHLILPVVSDMRQATNVLLWAIEKMEGRYDLMNRAEVRNIKSFNALGEAGLRERMGDDFNEERTPRHMPYIVIVIDEMADLMMASKKEAELSITRLAQKSRAVGIHVIVATQRPSTDVITGVLKGNLPTRIAFQVASKVDSRVILDSMGAEKLLGQGDMLYTPPQSSQIRRVQGALVEDHEIKAIVDFVAQESAPSFNQELVQTATGTRPAGSEKGGAEQDDLFDEAVRIILKSRRGSASLLQRALGIGYTRASRLIDIMTAEGIVGEHKGSKAREVLMSLDDWEEMQGAAAGQGTSHE